MTRADNALWSFANFVFGKEVPRAIFIAACLTSPAWLGWVVGS